MDNGIFDMIFNVLAAVIGVMQRLTFLGIPLFYWSVGFLIMGAVLSRLLNTLGSPYMDSASQTRARAEASARHNELISRQQASFRSSYDRIGHQDWDN